ncbi:MAG: DUF6516 family protein [Sulfuricurvum sp.]|jgi:hypothetical protein
MLLSNNGIYDLNDIINKLQSNGYETFRGFTKDLIETADTGYTIDTYIPMYGCNILKHSDISNFDSDHLNIDVESFDNFVKIAKDSNGNFLDIENGLFSVYNDFERFPVARLYIYEFENNMCKQDILKKLSSYNLELNSRDFNMLINASNTKQRIDEYLKTLDSRFEKLARYTQGKINNTSIIGGMIIAREDSICPICNKNKSSEIEEISFTNYTTGIQISLEVCKQCLSSSAKDNAILNFMFQEMNLPTILKDRELTIEEIREISNKIIGIFLHAEIKKEASSTNDTITAIIKNKYLLKLRISEISDYGYMILTLDEIELIRFDSANHHSNKIEFMPHHVHNNVIEEKNIKEEAKLLGKKKAKEHKFKINITDSFLTGFLGIDYISIKKRIEDLDAKGI